MSWLNCIHSNPSAVTQSVLRWPHARQYWADSELHFPTAMTGGGTAQLVAWSQTTVCPNIPWVFNVNKIIVLHLIDLKLIPSCKFQTCLIYTIQCWAATDWSSTIVIRVCLQEDLYLWNHHKELVCGLVAHHKHRVRLEDYTNKLVEIVLMSVLFHAFEIG